MNTRHIDFFLIQFTRFVRIGNMKLFCRSANQNKSNFRFTTLTKHINNKTNWCIGLEKNEENMDLSRIHLAILRNLCYRISQIAYCKLQKQSDS